VKSVKTTIIFGVVPVLFCCFKGYEFLRKRHTKVVHYKLFFLLDIIFNNIFIPCTCSRTAPGSGICYHYHRSRRRRRTRRNWTRNGSWSWAQRRRTWWYHCLQLQQVVHRWLIHGKLN